MLVLKALVPWLCIHRSVQSYRKKCLFHSRIQSFTESVTVFFIVLPKVTTRHLKILPVFLNDLTCFTQTLQIRLKKQTLYLHCSTFSLLMVLTVITSVINDVNHPLMVLTSHHSCVIFSHSKDMNYTFQQYRGPHWFKSFVHLNILVKMCKYIRKHFKLFYLN